MINHDPAMLVLHWIWASVFLLAGGVLLLKPRCFAGAQCMFRWTRFPDDATADRVTAALVRREQLEAVPRTIGIYSGICSLILGILAVVTWVQPASLYALFCVFLSGIGAATYLHLRNSAPKRVAVLMPRRSDAAVPTIWFVAAAINSLALALFLSDTHLRLSALFIFVASAVTLSIAWRFRQLPALLEGRDLPAEQIVDDRLRFSRSATVLYLAIAQPFVFFSQNTGETRAEYAVFLASFALAMVYLVWMLSKYVKPGSLAKA